MVGCESAKQPPWSTAMSTSTLPGRMRETSSLLTSFGAFAPGTSTEPMTRSEATTAFSISKLFEAIVLMRPA